MDTTPPAGFAALAVDRQAELSTDPAFPSTIHTVPAGRFARRAVGDTFYVFAHAGPLELVVQGRGRFTLATGMYARVPDAVEIPFGVGVVVARHGHRGTFLLGGPIEAVGRLRYIDGCTDSLLLPPDRLGDPCLNHLHFPPGIDQTMHTHPSCRLGLVHRGRGECVTPASTFPLAPGTAFLLPPDAHHKFRTYAEPMEVIAFHPHTDHGPSDEDHPMVNMTMVAGVSARGIDAIRTR